MKERMRLLTSLLAVLAMTGVSAQTATPVPRLLVTILVDQLRSDYMEAFMPLYGQQGFNRLLKEGRVYHHVRYPMAQVDPASAAATLFTGTVPFNHGIIAQQWMDRNTLRPQYCVDDPNYQGWMTHDASSPQNLLVSTLADELKIASGESLVYAFAPNRDAAVLAAGHAADGAFWINDQDGCWCGTSYYGSAPLWLANHEQAKTLSKRLRKFVYQPINGAITQVNYFSPNASQVPFKHKFTTGQQIADFKQSALVNDEVNQLVKACLDQQPLGQDGVTDMLSVAYYAGNFQHASIYERPQEMQDAYVRLDQSLGQLLDMIQEKVGLENALVVLTSTGCQDTYYPDLSPYRIPQGTFYMNRTQALLNMYFMASYGQGRYVDAAFGNQIYLNHRQLEEKQIDLFSALDKAQEFLCQCAGVRQVYTRRNLLLGGGAPDVNLLKNSFNTKCSGDIIIELIPGWKLQNEELQTAYQQPTVLTDFPLIFLGQHIVNQHVFTPVTVDVVAPTVAKSLRIRAPNACTTTPLSDLNR